MKILIVATLTVAVIGAVALKQGKAPAYSNSAASPAATVSAPRDASDAKVESEVAAPLPKLLDLGAGKCIPCKMMAPLLEELKKDYAGRMDVQFIDVWQNPDAGKAYGIEMIPTQIFYDASGKELFRHTGFFGKEDILGKWKELGVDLAAAEKK